VLIPGGLTYLLQPLDMSFNHSFKTEVHKEWKSYLNSYKEHILSPVEHPQEERKEIEAGIPSGFMNSDDIKNSHLRKMLKQGMFEEVRKKNERIIVPPLNY